MVQVKSNRVPTRPIWLVVGPMHHTVYPDIAAGAYISALARYPLIWVNPRNV